MTASMHAGERTIADLRDWLEQVERIGELTVVRGVDPVEELGAIVELWGTGAQALLFDEIRGYPPGFRVLAHSCSSLARIALGLGLPPNSDAMELVRALRGKLRELQPLPARLVDSGPVLEHTHVGDELDVLEFPAPRWNELDGGRFLGTGCAVITRDPDTGWVNLGTYRVQVHDRRTVGVFIAPGKHGALTVQKYWERGQACPVAVSVGHDPLLFMLSGVEVPHGVSEYDVAGALRGRPVDVLQAPVTGLPIPAAAEIVLEGSMPPGVLHPEGPFGEWLGYYAGEAGPKPVIQVEAIHHRDDPIILGAPPGKPPSDNTFYNSVFKSAAIWDEIEKAGVPGVEGVWGHPAGGGRVLLVVAVRQLYPGHARQAGYIAANCHAGAYANRYVVMVDHDIDPADTDAVLWAICTRTDPDKDLELMRQTWTSPLDPMHYTIDGRPGVFNNRLLVDATRPWGRLADFPPVVEASPALRARVLDKWRNLFQERRPTT